MKTLKPYEFIKLLSTIAFNICTSLTNYKLFKTIKLEPEKWPDCDAKKILIEFEVMARQKSFEFAFYTTQEKTKDFHALKENLFESTPQDLNEIKMLIDHNVKIHWVKILARKLQEDPQEYDHLIHQLNKVNQGTSIEEEYDVGDYIGKAIEKNESLIKEGKSQIVIPDFSIFSEQIGGFNSQRVSGISAESGFGKTKLAINIADSARYIMPVYYFNMEMSPEDFESQFIQKNGGITYKQYKSGNYQHAFEKIMTYQASFENTHRITFTNGKSLSCEQICAKILVKMNVGGLVIVDYDQKMTGLGDNEDKEWLQMLKNIEKLEDVAKTTQSHIIVLFQADDGGFAKSSKRSIQPLSVFTHFTKTDSGQFILKNIKNRFGVKGFEIVMDYWPETTTIREKHLRDDLIGEATHNDNSFKKRRPAAINTQGSQAPAHWQNKND